MDDPSISFLTDLDTIFDTRMGVIEGYGGEVVQEAVKGGYFHRVIDIFSGIDMEDYAKRYAARDESVLRKSMVTPVLQEIRRFMWKTLAANVSTPLTKRPRLVLNIYPYALSKPFLESIHKGLIAVTEKNIEIVIIDQRPEDIPLRDIKEHYAMVAMYHYAEWLENLTLNKQLERTQCPQVFLLAPKLIRDIKGLSLMKTTDVFGAIEQYTSLFFKLKLMDAQSFSVDMDRLALMLKQEHGKRPS